MNDQAKALRVYLSRLYREVGGYELLGPSGRVVKVVGLTIESMGPRLSIGDLCYLYPQRNKPGVLAEAVGFKGKQVVLMPLGEMVGIGPGSTVEPAGRPLSVGVGPGLLGRVLDGLGRPIDGKGGLKNEDRYPVDRVPLGPMERERVTEPLAVGVRAIDGLLTCGKGQRVGIFSGSGVGKSTLLGMIARNTAADVTVIALVGERGREVRDFLERDLGEVGLKRSVVVAATWDQPPLVRIKAAMVATAIAEYFRDCGLDVILMMDSVTRLALAQREIGLAVGEPPTTRGYPPSVFALLPRLLERTGNCRCGSITGFYTVLVEGDDLDEPISDAVRGILDGHIILSRELAAANHYPAIDVLNSISRVMADVVSADHRQAAGRLRSLLATYREAEDLINIGAYVDGSNPEIDQAREMMGTINGFLRQAVEEKDDFETTRRYLLEMFGEGS